MSRARYPPRLPGFGHRTDGGNLVSYGRIGGTVGRSIIAGEMAWRLDARARALTIATLADYQRFAASDSAWRALNARQYDSRAEDAR